jgi:acyl carrier protein
VETSDLLALVHDLVEADVSATALSLDDELDDLGWDSLSNVEFIARVDVALGVTVDAQRLADCTTVRDLHDLTLPSAA